MHQTATRHPIRPLSPTNSGGTAICSPSIYSRQLHLPRKLATDVLLQPHIGNSALGCVPLRPRAASTELKTSATPVRPASSTMSYLRDLFKTAAVYAIGFFYAALITPLYFIRFLFNPIRFLRKIDRQALELSDPLPNITHEHVDLGNDVSIHIARTGGAPHKPVMLLVHGCPEFWGSWKHQMEHFRDLYDVVAIDMRGYGLSSKPKGLKSYTVVKLAADIAGVIRAVGGNKPVVLVGHDWGGAVCWQTAHLYPELIRKLVIACAPHPKCLLRSMDFNQFLRSWYVYLFQVPWLPEFLYRSSDYALLDEAIMKACKRTGAVTAADMELYKKEIARPGALEAALNYYRAMMLPCVMPAHERELIQSSLRRNISCPTLFIWADSDPYLGPQLVEGVERYVDTLQKETLKNCGHFAQQDRPEEFNRLVEDFLQEKAIEAK
jgi:epoxide hydrolase 4